MPPAIFDKYKATSCLKQFDETKEINAKGLLKVVARASKNDGFTSALNCSLLNED